MLEIKGFPRGWTAWTAVPPLGFFCFSQYAETNIRLKMQEGRVDRIDAEKDVFREKMACNHFKSEINPENGYRCFDRRKSI